jgi:manganese efflux pump family protein
VTSAVGLKLAAFVVPLGFDTLAVAVLLGLGRAAPLRPALTFGVFEAVMPLVGLILGRIVGPRSTTLAVVLGGLVLIGVAIHVLREAIEGGEEVEGLSFGNFRLAAAAGLGVSMDELTVGFPMGTSGLPIPETLATIGAQAFAVTFLGVLFGRRVNAGLGRTASRAAGFIAAAAFGLLGVYLIIQRFVPGLPEI